MTEKQLQGVGIFAVLIGLLLVGFNVAFPIPSAGKVVQTKANQEKKLRKEVEVVRKRITEDRAKNEARLWTQNADQVSATVMANVSTEAMNLGLKMTAFRPQRPQDDQGVTRHPYLVTLQGPYPQILQLLKVLEKPENRLVVYSLQVASSDESNEHVTASAGIVTYRELESKS